MRRARRRPWTVTILAAALLSPVAVLADKLDDDPGDPDFFDLSATPQYQSLRRDGGHNANVEVDFIGLLTLRDGKGKVGATRVGWWWLYNDTFSGTSTHDLARRTGLLWDFNDGDAPGAEDALGVFAVQQHLAGDHLVLQLGKLYPGNDFAESDYWGDDRATFLSTMMASDVAGRWFNNIGLGAHLAWFDDGWFAQAAVVDAEAGHPYFDFASLRRGKFLWIAELGVQPRWGDGETRLTVTPYTIDRTRALQREKGLVLAFTHEWSNLALFGRYTWRNGGEGRSAETAEDELPVKRGGFVGLAWNRPLGRPSDQLALAVMQGEPGQQARREGFGSQHGLELYWLFQPSSWLLVTPDLQLVKNRDGATETILGLRVKLRFGSEHWNGKP